LHEGCRRLNVVQWRLEFLGGFWVFSKFLYRCFNRWFKVHKKLCTMMELQSA